MGRQKCESTGAGLLERENYACPESGGHCASVVIKCEAASLLHTQTHTHTHTQTHSQTHTLTLTHSQTHTHRHTQIHTCTDTLTLTKIHTHSHTRSVDFRHVGIGRSTVFPFRLPFCFGLMGTKRVKLPKQDPAAWLAWRGGPRPALRCLPPRALAGDRSGQVCLRANGCLREAALPSPDTLWGGK